jgi:hypothetical protein
MDIKTFQLPEFDLPCGHKAITDHVLEFLAPFCVRCGRKRNYSEKE